MAIWTFIRHHSFTWRRPRQNTVLIYPKGKTSDILLHYLNPAAVGVIDPWGSELNIPTLLLTVFRGGRTRFDYLKATISLIRPKFVITTTDNDMLFYQLKDALPNVITIAVQNGLRGNYSSIPHGGFFDEVSTRKNLRSDYVIAFGTEIAAIYQQNIETKVFVGGSIRNNSFASTNSGAHLKRPIVYVSQLPSKQASPNDIVAYLQNHPITFSEFYDAEKEIVEKIRRYCKEKDLEFLICGKQSSKFEEESEFFAGVALSSRNAPLDSYATLDSAGIIVTLESTLGYEFHARGKRVIFVGGRFAHHANNDVRDSQDVKFGSPAQLPPDGSYWMSDLSEAKLRDRLDFLNQSSDDEVHQMNGEFKDRFMAFDPNNQELVKFFASIGIPTRSTS